MTNAYYSLVRRQLVRIIILKGIIYALSHSLVTRGCTKSGRRRGRFDLQQTAKTRLDYYEKPFIRTLHLRAYQIDRQSTALGYYGIL